MKLKKILIAFVILQWLFVIAAVIVRLYEQSCFTGILTECRYFLHARHFTSFQVGLLFFAVGMNVVNIVASVALCWLKRWARTVYLWSIVIFSLTMLIIFEPDLMPPVYGFLSGCSSIFIGIIISLVYWSPLASEFKGKVSNNKNAPD